MDKMKRILKIFATAFLVFLVTLCIYTFVVTDIMKKDYVNVFGYSYFVVASGSMSGTIEVDDIVIVKITKDVNVGDVITFRSKEGDIITHRLVDKKNNTYVTMGDVNNVRDDAISKDNIIGKMKFAISPGFIIKCIAVFLIIFIFFALVNFDWIFKKIIVKDQSKEQMGTVPDHIFENPKKREEDAISGLTVTIPLKDVEMMKKAQEKEQKKKEEIELLDDDGFVEMNPKSLIDDKEQEVIEVVLALLKCKRGSVDKSRMNPKWVVRYQYVYKLCHLLLMKETEKLVELVNTPPFKEIYDYDLDTSGLTESIRNRIYQMPIPIFMMLLTHSILYNDDEMFDGIYKILKYKVMFDMENKFKEIKDTDQQARKQLNSFIEFMEKVSNEYDNKNVFELEKVKETIK